jgi:VacB/RNase II family 3'-5' exoribonuclease
MNPLSSLHQTPPSVAKIHKKAKAASAQGSGPVDSRGADRVESGGGDWKAQLAQFGQVLAARERLGLSDALNNKEAGELVQKVLADTSPTEDLAVIADRRMAENGMVPGFTNQILEAAAITRAATPDHPSVVDLRHLPMISVDNGDLNPLTGKLENASQDIDQCEYAEQLPNGNIKMLVAIADVDSLVKKGDLIDNQAMRHGATVYTDSKIYPMIPPNFSEELTSLDEGKDRLATIKEFQVTPEGEIVEPKLYRGYITNRAQMAYDSVNEWLTNGQGPRPPQLADPQLAEQITLQDQAAQRLFHHFHARGSLDIESSETKARLADGEVLSIKKEEQSRAKDKVKFNMMAANITTMQVLDGAGMPTLRRIVKTPEKWDRIVELAKKYDYGLPSDPDAKALNAFLEARKQADPRAHEELCSEVVRLVGRGEYVVARPGEPIEGHFNLAAPEYGHTTAPNRRAPDLVNQRIEKAYAHGEPCPYTPEELEELATHFSSQEKVIAGIEKEVHRSASAKLMKDKIGQSFDGQQSRQLANGSTLVRLEGLHVTGVVKGQLNGEVGDDVRVTLQGVNVEKGWIDLSLANEQSVDGFLFKP